MSKLKRKFTKEQKLEIVKMSLEDNLLDREVAERFTVLLKVIYYWHKSLCNMNTLPSQAMVRCLEPNRKKDMQH
ncbi:MAG: transposase [Saprospiraceae bacterium]|nr:transposase [Candidatus Vicinibacter affinis]MBP6522785.1 transposase [Saprospiraceae bacterium]MBK6573614.1 transposase [Candidatus Vicinibacter affinis]MBK6821932.1 transposase [Candidatus Vicinibacter affinis]MBK7302287.1 transposase [Candidatus Vicinibacter affinis]